MRSVWRRQFGTIPRFCGDCGAPITVATGSARGAGVAASATATVASGGTATPTELRLVSVLFCDLVGFTPLAESRDPEEVSELLSRYFDLATSVRALRRRRREVHRRRSHGGLGAPAAQEDDAERAVRAGLELVSAVASFGSELAHFELAARVGVVTGQAATTETPPKRVSSSATG